MMELTQLITYIKEVIIIELINKHNFSFAVDIFGHFFV